ncbi:MAG: hypothetical protein CL908_14660 [Deltaproteobacteria bacterium]|nr:hypothetical protein [Deltaproteobacteria bacterium]
MPASHFILLIESDTSRADPLATRLVRLGVEPIRVADLDEAVATVKSKRYAVGGGLVPSDLVGKQVARAIKHMRRREPMLPAMTYGKVPSPDQRKQLRQAGVLLALWDGYDEAVLRFQVNRLVSGEHQPAVRSSRRAPTHIPTRILVGGREKEGVVYSLSAGGCFIETPRASMDGACLKLIFTLEDLQLAIEGVVAFSNVPGNLQRPNLPLGMGVRFEKIGADAHGRITRFIHEQLETLEV